MSGAVAIRHVDLSSPEPAVPATEAVLDIYWWKALPLGARRAKAEELPLGPGQMRALAVELLGEQLSAREAVLGAPLRATYDGRPKWELTLEGASRLDRMVERLDGHTQSSKVSAAGISLIICTRDRGAALAACLRSVDAQRSPPGEIIVVDNSASGSARTVCEDFPHVVWVHEPRPGLSVARNAGIRAAKHDLIAFTDDDVEPHPGWLAEIARVFGETDAEAVTGLVLPASLDTPAQRCFQFDMGGFGFSFVPALFEQRFLAESRPLGPPVWRIGAGANMAFRRSAFDRAGLFDERLGAGASGCAEDSEFWYRLLALGGACQYEPRAVVFHHHRADWPGLKRQMRAYVRGHVSALVAQYDNFSNWGDLRRIIWQLPGYFLRMAIQNLGPGRGARRAIFAQELLGWAAGLQYLLRPGWRSSSKPASGLIARRALGPFLACNPFPHGWTDGLFYREKMRAIHRIAPPSIGAEDRILEIGGGRSGMASYLYPGADITTIDIDPELGAGVQETARTRFVCGDARNLPFPDGHFAVVTLFDVLEHIDEDALAAREALRVTRKGGHVLVSTPAADWRYPHYSVMKRVCPHESELMREWGHVRRGYRPQDLEKLFGGAAESSATFINPVTAFFHDVAFSRLRARWRKLLYAAAALPTVLAYALHGRSTRGTEAAFAWRR